MDIDSHYWIWRNYLILNMLLAGVIYYILRIHFFLFLWLARYGARGAWTRAWVRLAGASAFFDLIWAIGRSPFVNKLHKGDIWNFVLGYVSRGLLLNISLLIILCNRPVRIFSHRYRLIFLVTRKHSESLPLVQSLHHLERSWVERVLVLNWINEAFVQAMWLNTIEFLGAISKSRERGSHYGRI